MSGFTDIVENLGLGCPAEFGIKGRKNTVKLVSTSLLEITGFWNG